MLIHKKYAIRLCGTLATLTAVSATQGQTYSANDAPIKVETVWYPYGCYMDCYTDETHLDGVGRRLPIQMYSGDSELTPEKCVKACQKAGHSWAGLQWGTECWCGDGDGSEATLGPETDAKSCNVKCSKSGASCGGGCRNNIWGLSPKP